MQAKDLVIGQRFESKHCKATIRDLICLRKSYTAVYVSCEQRADINSLWKRTREYIACESEVEPKEEIVDITRDGYGSITINEPETELPIIKKAKKAKGKRGRKRVEINFPRGKFTIPEVAKENNVSVTAVYLKLLELQKAGNAKIVSERASSGRGRPTKIWKVLT